MKKWNKNIPDGTRDYIFDECILPQEIEKRLAKIYSERGYRCLMTPLTEYYDVFDIKNKFMSQESMYKLTDMGGRLIVMRPDNTTPVARVVSSRLKDEPLPLKIFCNQHVYRINSNYSGKQCEILQSSAEIIGGDIMKGDITALSTAFSVLDSIGELGGDYVIEIGHAGFYKALITNLNLNEEEAEKALEYIATKDSSEVGFLEGEGDSYKKARQIIMTLPSLYGGYEVFAAAEKLACDNPEALKVLDYLKKIYTVFKDAGFGGRIMIDLGIAHEIDYYTGMVFCAYSPLAGEPIISGGRYDELFSNFGRDIPAVGFALNIDLIAEAIRKRYGTKSEDVPDAIVFFEPSDLGTALEYIRIRDIKKYELSVCATLEETVNLAKIRGIKNVISVCGGIAEEINVGKEMV